jgi:hypothetical protein
LRYSRIDAVGPSVRASRSDGTLCTH